MNENYDAAIDRECHLHMKGRFGTSCRMKDWIIRVLEICESSFERLGEGKASLTVCTVKKDGRSLHPSLIKHAIEHGWYCFQHVGHLLILLTRLMN